MRAYTRAKLIRTKLKSVSVSVSFGEINSEKNKVRVSFSVARVCTWNRIFYAGNTGTSFGSLFWSLSIQVRYPWHYMVLQLSLCMCLHIYIYLAHRWSWCHAGGTIYSYTCILWYCRLTSILYALCICLACLLASRSTMHDKLEWACPLQGPMSRLTMKQDF